jgi:hypothetical protein
MKLRSTVFPFGSTMTASGGGACEVETSWMTTKSPLTASKVKHVGGPPGSETELDTSVPKSIELLDEQAGAFVDPIDVADAAALAD